MQYPHTLESSIITGGSKDSSGNWTAGTPSTRTEKCRAEASSGNGFNTVEGPNGSRISYSWNIYLPKGTSVIAVGTNIEVKDEKGFTLLNGDVKRFLPQRFNCRIWV